MYKFLCQQIGYDKDLPERAHTLSNRMRVLDGSLYDILQYPFHEERDNQNKYIPIRKRRPSARYNVSRIIVNDTVGMLFGDTHFPRVSIEGKPEEEKILARFIKETQLEVVMNAAAYNGSVGSIAVRFRVFDGICFFDTIATRYLTPIYKENDPECLAKVVEQYKCTGADLKANGYTIAKKDLSAKYWFKREWDENAEIWYHPKKIPIDKENPSFTIDTVRTTVHGLEFVPLVWIENLPGGDKPEGLPTFSNEVIDIGIEIDYLLSQGGRGLKYSSQPSTVIKSDDNSAKIVAGDTIVVPVSGDAKLLEISGDAAEAVVNYVRFLRELALEDGGGNRTDASKLTAAKSGRAMEMMNQGLINVASKLRSSYGSNGLLEVLRMLIKTRAKHDLKFKSDGTVIPKLSPDAQLSLVWPAWQPPTTSDINELSGALSVGKTAGIISTETAVTVLSPILDVEDIAAEVAAIKSETAEDAALQMKIKSTPAKPDKSNE